MATEGKTNQITKGRAARATAGGTKQRTAAVATRRASGKTRAANATARTQRSAGRARSPAWRPQERTQFLIDAIGGVTSLARALGVSPSQPSRWKSGDEVPSPEIAARLLDLDHVVAFGMQAWDPAVLMDWMSSANGFLDGARPIEVLRHRGSAEVIDALRATISGAYA